jgi:hypothetical protein
VNAIGAPKQEQDRWAVLPALFLHKGKCETPDLTERVLLVKVEDLCPSALWELNDGPHA